MEELLRGDRALWSSAAGKATSRLPAALSRECSTSRMTASAAGDYAVPAGSGSYLTGARQPWGS